MKIAIIGAGFAGLAAAWHLLQQKNMQVTIFDHVGIGGKASGIAAGLLHPFSGLHAKLNRFGFEGFEETSLLLEASEQAIQKKVFESSPLLRIALTKTQQDDYLKCSLSYPRVDFLEPQECQNLIPSLAPYPGILIKDAKVIYVDSYLKGLLSACLSLNAKFEQVKIDDLSTLKDFTHIVVAAGADSSRFLELQQLPFSYTKGQILTLEWPKEIPPLPLALNSQAYIIMSPDKKTCIAGATFEKDYQGEQPDLQKAEADIMPKVTALIPKLKNAKIIGCKSAFRVSSKNHLPFVEEINPRLFVFSGLGSKGLIYHGLYAKKLVNLML